MLGDDRCRGCARENRPCQYKGHAVSRRRCTHYEVRGAKPKSENNSNYVQWFNTHKNGQNTK